MSEQSLVDLARSYWAAEAKRDTAAVLDHYAEDAVLEHPGGVLVGHEQIASYYDQGAASFPELEVNIVHWVGDQQEAAIEWTAVLITADHRRLPVRGVNVIRVANGRFISVHTYFQAPTLS